MPSINMTATQYGASQVQLQEAKRIAAQAEQTANALQTAARNARLDAERATDKARTLESRSDRASNVAQVARQGLAAADTRGAAFSRLQTTLDAVVTRIDNKADSVPVQPVVNAQGETTGQIVNTTA